MYKFWEVFKLKTQIFRSLDFEILSKHEDYTITENFQSVHMTLYYFHFEVLIYVYIYWRSSRVLLHHRVQVADISYVGESVFCMCTQWNARRISGGFVRGKSRIADVRETSGGNRAFHVQNGSTRHFHSTTAFLRKFMKCLRNTKLYKFAHACCVYLRQDTCLRHSYRRT